MKTCKKILASVLALAMVLSMCTFAVSADGEAVASSVLYSLNSFEGETVGTSKTSGAYAQDANMIGSAAGGLNLRGAGNGAAVVVEEDEKGNKYISSLHSSLGYNHRQTTNEISALVDLTAYPVICASWDIMIPAEDTYKTNTRTMTVALGANSLTANANISTAKVTIKDGVITGSEDNSTVEYSNPVNYTYGSWINVKVLGWVTDAGNMQIATYVGDDLIYLGVSKSTGTKGLATNAYDFRYTVTNPVEGGADITSETCYDNIKMEFLPATAKVSLADVQYKRILDASVDSLLTPSDTYAGNITDDAETGIRTIAAGKAGDIVGATGLTSSRILQGGSTKAASTYQVVTEGDRKYLSAKSTNYQYLTNTMRKSFADYVNDGETHTLVGSYDIYIPSAIDATERKHIFTLTLDAAASGTYRRIDSDLELNSVIKGGKIEFNSSGLNQGTDVSGAERSESRTISADTWNTITYVAEITNGTDSYTVDVYGVFKNEVIYKNSHIIEYLDYNEDGVSDDIGFNSNNFYITPASTDTEFETRIDNIYFEKNNNFDWSGINTNAWVNRRVELALDESGNVDVDASKSEGSFASGILVIALYDSNGKVIEILKSTEITDGKFVYEVPVAKVATANMLKGFVFDTLTSAKPLITHGVFVIK